MPTGGHFVIVMTFATSVAHGNRPWLLIRGLDRESCLIVKGDQVRDRGAVAIVPITQSLALFRRLAKGERAGQQRKRQQ